MFYFHLNTIYVFNFKQNSSIVNVDRLHFFISCAVENMNNYCLNILLIFQILFPFSRYSETGHVEVLVYMRLITRNSDIHRTVPLTIVWKNGWLKASLIEIRCLGSTTRSFRIKSLGGSATKLRFRHHVILGGR